MPGFGDSKYEKLVNLKSSKTKNLDLNVVPINIGFDDAFVALNVFDHFTSIGREILKLNYMPPVNIVHPFDGKLKHLSLSDLICEIYNKLSDQNFLKRFKSILTKMKKIFGNYFTESDLFINNTCPKCGEFGYKKPVRKYNCNKCGYEIVMKQKVIHL